MLKYFRAAALLFIVSPVYAFDLQSVTADKLGVINPPAAVPEAVAAPLAEKGSDGVKSIQSVYLPYYIGTGYKTFTAKDPLSGIEVLVKDAGERKYSYEIITDGRKQAGVIGVFFPDRYEMTGGATNLKMSEHAFWLITGQLETPGANGGSTRVDIRLAGDFDQGEWSGGQLINPNLVAYGNGLNLTITANFVRGTMDTGVYPKETAGAIAAFCMALYHGNPNFSEWVAAGN